MKARVKATGEIIEIAEDYTSLYAANFDKSYSLDELEFLYVKEKYLPKDEPDYWDKLHHQAAIATMQGVLANNELWYDIMRGVYPTERQKYLAKEVNKYAAELVNKLKEESQCEK